MVWPCSGSKAAKTLRVQNRGISDIRRRTNSSFMSVINMLLFTLLKPELCLVPKVNCDLFKMKTRWWWRWSSSSWELISVEAHGFHLNSKQKEQLKFCGAATLSRNSSVKPFGRSRVSAWCMLAQQRSQKRRLQSVSACLSGWLLQMSPDGHDLLLCHCWIPASG